MTKNTNISISSFFAILYKNTHGVFQIFVFCVITFVLIKIKTG